MNKLATNQKTKTSQGKCLENQLCTCNLLEIFDNRFNKKF
ncbi:hypothetical protein IHE45_12G023800 [Dioscorea alata]|uniref:Uncharacterized protein n=1 Tax=Dioscorea alata TaxID=55571 RepID=A0ACB7V0V6_DIOAL|nr:hypothetical protein IHE45_12G023800 [Dioscorea alata]